MLVMHGAFDVGMHNKRLTLFINNTSAPYMAPEPTRASRSACITVDKIQCTTAVAKGVSPVVPVWRLLQLCAVLLSYVLIIVTDYIGPPRVHGSKLAILFVMGCPSLVLFLQLQDVWSHAAVTVVGAHFVVTLSFLADSQRFERETVSLTTLCALAAVLVSLATCHRPADMTACMLSTCAGAYVGALLILALLQWTDVLDAMTLLTLQQLYVFMTLLLAGLVRGPAHC